MPRLSIIEISGIQAREYVKFSSPIAYLRGFALALAVLVLASAVSVLAGLTDFTPGLLSYVKTRWGSVAVDRLHAWHQMEIANPPVAQGFVSETQWVIHSNIFWDAIPYQTDQQTWGVPDYWTTPVEALGVNFADCEDYAIGKYFTLKDLGLPIQKLRITYVRALRWNEPHMVLAYYPTPDADPYILDNLTPHILPASQRTDLEPVYSFNDEDLWAGEGSEATGKSNQIRLWRDLLDKMARERQL